jgi:hypothetical protein
MAKGFLYLVVIMDWVSRAVLAWRLSNTLDADFCVEALEEALSRYGRPEIFNTDQGSQFTSDDFTGTLKRHGVTISMDGKGRCMDNIFVERLWRSLKYEEVYLHAYAPWPKPRPALAPGWNFTTPSASIRAWVIARRGKFTRKACGYVDDRRCRLAALPPLPEPARKAGKCSPSTTYPQALQSTKRFILMLRKAEALHQPLHRQLSEPTSKPAGLHLEKRLRLSHKRGPPHLEGRHYYDIGAAGAAVILGVVGRAASGLVSSVTG